MSQDAAASDEVVSSPAVPPTGGAAARAEGSTDDPLQGTQSMAQSAPYPFPLPVFSQEAQANKWLDVIEKLLQRPDLKISEVISNTRLRALVDSAMSIFGDEPSCLAVSVIKARLPGASAPGGAPRHWADALSPVDGAATPGTSGAEGNSPSKVAEGPVGAYQAAADLVMVGDIHGQYADLLHSVLAVQGRARAANLPDKTFLFLGDYVDRGPQSVETLVLLLALKVEYPDRVLMIRGNHEESNTCKTYGFMHECRSKLTLPAWYQFTALFNELPLAAIVYTTHGRLFCCHGGLSPGILNAAEDSLGFTIRQNYGQGLGGDELVDGLLWSDPSQGKGFKPNSRGCGYHFGRDVTEHFCSANKFEMVVRAHQMVAHGYFWDHDHRLLTIFSAPRYCGMNDNLGAICIVHSHSRWLELDQSQPVALDEKTQQPLRVSPLAPTIGGRECPLENLLEFVGFDSVMGDEVIGGDDDDDGAAAGAPPSRDEAPMLAVTQASPSTNVNSRSPRSSPPPEGSSGGAGQPAPDPLNDPAVDDYFGASMDGDFCPPAYDDE